MVKFCLFSNSWIWKFAINKRWQSGFNLKHIWLYTENNSIKLKLIEPNVLKNLIINEDNIIINNDNITKKIKYKEIDYNISNYSNDCTLYNDNVKYIMYRNIYLFELNENILQMLKKLLISNDKYNIINEYIWNNRFSKSKILLVFNNNNMNMKIINKSKNKNKINNLDNLINIYDSYESITNFLLQ